MGKKKILLVLLHVLVPPPPLPIQTTIHMGGHPFLQLARAVVADVQRMLVTKTIAELTATYLELLAVYFETSKLKGSYSRAVVMQGLAVLSAQLRAHYSVAKDDDAGKHLALMLDVLKVMTAESRRAVDLGFEAGPSDYHAAVCRWDRHKDHVWVAECLALAIVVYEHSFEANGAACWDAVASLLHPDDWKKVYEHLSDMPPMPEDSPSPLALGVRATVFLRASLPNVAGTCVWVLQVRKCLVAFPDILGAPMPVELMKHIVSSAVQVAQFWAATGARYRMRDALALLSLFAPWDIAPSFFLALWSDVLERQGFVIVPVCLPPLWSRWQNSSFVARLLDRESAALSASTSSAAEGTFAVSERSCGPLVIHDMDCPLYLVSNSDLDDCVCGAQSAAETCLGIIEAEDSGDDWVLKTALEQEPLTAPLTRVPWKSSIVEFVGPVWEVANAGSCLHRVLFCVGDCGPRRLPFVRDSCLTPSSSDSEDDALSSAASTASTASTAPFASFGAGSMALLAKCDVCGGRKRLVRVRGGRACGRRVVGAAQCRCAAPVRQKGSGRKTGGL